MKTLLEQVQAKEITIEQALAYTFDEGRRDVVRNQETIDSLEEALKQDLDNAKDEILEEQYPEYLLAEYVGARIPIYNQSLIEVLSSDTSLSEPEDWGVVAGDVDIFKILRWSIYERLSAVGQEWLEEARK